MRSVPFVRLDELAQCGFRQWSAGRSRAVDAGQLRVVGQGASVDVHGLQQLHHAVGRGLVQIAPHDPRQRGDHASRDISLIEFQRGSHRQPRGSIVRRPGLEAAHHDAVLIHKLSPVARS